MRSTYEINFIPLTELLNDILSESIADSPIIGLPPHKQWIIAGIRPQEVTHHARVRDFHWPVNASVDVRDTFVAQVLGETTVHTQNSLIYYCTNGKIVKHAAESSP